MADTELKTVITAETDQAESALDSFGNSLQRVGEVAVGIGLEKVAEKFIELGEAIVSTGVQGAASMENMKVSFDIAFGGDVAGPLLAQLNHMADLMPVDNELLNQFALKMKNAGVATKDIPNFLKDISNVASGTGMSMQDMGNVMQTAVNQYSTAVQRGGVSTKQLRAIANEGIPIYDALVTVMNKQGGALIDNSKDAEKASKSYADLTDKLKFAKAQLSILESQHGKTEIETKKHDLAVAKLKDTIADYEKGLNKAGGAMKNVSTLHKITKDDLVSGGKDIKISAKQFEEAFAFLSSGKYAGAAEKQAQTFNGTMKNLKSTIQETLMGIAGINADTGEIFKGGLFDTLKDAAMGLFQFLNDHKAEITTFFTTFVVAFGIVWRELDGILIPAFNAFFSLIMSAAPGIAGAFDSFYEVIDNIALFVTTVLIPTFQALWPSIQGVIKSIADGIKSIYDALAKQVAEILPMILKMWNDHKNQILPLLKMMVDMIKNLFQAMVPVIVAAINFIGAAIKLFLETINFLFKGHWNDIFQTVKGALNFIYNTIKLVMDAVIGVLNIATNLMQGNWKGAWTAMKNTFKAIWEDIKNMAKSYIDYLTGIINSISGAFSNIGNAISGGGKTKSNGKQAGGFASGLTMVGESGPELVSLPQGSYVHNKSESSKMMQSFSPTININNPSVRSNGDIDAIVNEVKRALGRQNELAKLGAI